MTLKKRLDRLEGATMKLETEPCAIVREIVQPSATGPELVAMILRPLHGGYAVQIDRAPGETEAETRTRFAAERYVGCTARAVALEQGKQIQVGSMVAEARKWWR